MAATPCTELRYWLDKVLGMAHMAGADPHSIRVAKLAAVAIAFAITGALPAPLALAQTEAVQLEDAPENYPAGAHRDQTYYFCTACHSFKLVAQQGMTRVQWEETFQLMTDKHAMPPPDPKEREQFLDYLSAAFPPKQKGGWQNPFQP